MYIIVSILQFRNTVTQLEVSYQDAGQVFPNTDKFEAIPQYFCHFHKVTSSKIILNGKYIQINLTNKRLIEFNCP